MIGHRSLRVVASQQCRVNLLINEMQNVKFNYEQWASAFVIEFTQRAGHQSTSDEHKSTEHILMAGVGLWFGANNAFTGSPFGHTTTPKRKHNVFASKINCEHLRSRIEWTPRFVTLSCRARYNTVNALNSSKLLIRFDSGAIQSAEKWAIQVANALVASRSPRCIR